MRLNLVEQANRTARWALFASLAGCAGEIDCAYQPASEALASIASPAGGDTQVSEGLDGGAARDLDERLPDVADAGAGETAAHNDPLGPSCALGANPNDPCGPNGEGPRLPWGQCETRRGLRCVLPPRGTADGLALCACPPGASFEGGVCSSGDWSAPGDLRIVEPALARTSALGANPGDCCELGTARAFWAQ